MTMTKQEFEAQFLGKMVFEYCHWLRLHEFTVVVDYHASMDFEELWDWGRVENGESRIVVKHKGKNIAYMVVVLSDPDEPAICMIEADPSYRHMGIGRALVKTVSGPCRACGVDNVDFWRRQGFEFDPENDLDMLRK